VTLEVLGLELVGDATYLLWAYMYQECNATS
jgi:hypothetical protein